MNNNTTFKGSTAYNSIVGATPRQLNNCKPYYETAIAYHKKEGNSGQVEFFSEGLRFIEAQLAHSPSTSSAPTEQSK